MKPARVWLGVVCLLVGSGCVYYNTFFHAKQAFNEAEKQRLLAHQEIARGGAAQKYDEAIKKASSVLQNHPKSKYADDALLLIAKSFYYTGDFSRAREKCIELSGVFRDSKLLPEAKFYQGMSEYYLKNAEKALVMLREMSEKADDKSLRERASFMLARIPFEEEKYEDALVQLGLFDERFGGSDLSLRADSMLAASYWEIGRFDSARVAYKHLYDEATNLELRFAAIFRQAESMYQLGDFEQGLKRFRELAKDERYFSHKGMVEYEIGMGLFSVDSIESALEILRRLPQDYPRTEAAARSLFALGDIYQMRGDSLSKAQGYFQEIAKVWTTDPEFAQAALERGREITEMLALKQDLSGADSSSYAESHFLLGELFLRQLDIPDSALEEFRLVVDDYSESDYAPLAMMNLAEVFMESRSDSVVAKDIWGSLVARYPGSEASIWARRRLGMPPPLDITQSDILLMYGAETMLFDEHNPDSALVLYDLLIRTFPHSHLLAQAHFAQAWILETHHAREDSAVYLAYERVATDFPGTPYAEAANNRIHPQVRVARNIAAARPDSLQRDTLYTDTASAKTTIAELADTVRTAPVPLEEGVFDYPQVPNFTWPTAVTVVFKIHINDQGRVENDLELIGSSGYDDIDNSARIAMLQTKWDPHKLDAFLTLTHEWYKYAFLIPPPGKSKEDYLQNPTNDPFGTVPPK